jgi:hypothetical protein
MKFPVVALVAASLLIVSCGHDNGTSVPPTVTTQILSDATYDGDISLDAAGAFTVTQGNTESVFAGVDPNSFVEYRAFLDFPLGGSGGVPLDAIIVSAYLDIVITGINPQPLAGAIPIRIDLVSFQPPTLVQTDFDRTQQPALKTITIAPPISQSDFGQHVTVDVTSLMVQAQRLRLPDFQVRILEDLGYTTAGVIEINDTTGPFRSQLAPLLQVNYF